jgi:HK97 family phage major capsid protein
MPQTYKRLGGIFIPMSLRGEGLREQFGAVGRAIAPMLQQRITEMLTRVGTIDSQTANAIKEVVFTEYGGELINILRNLALVVRMGARVLTGLSSPIAFPRQTQDVTATWVAENPGTDVADSNVKTDLVTVTPRTLQAATKYSRQLLVQSSVDVEAMVRESIAAAHALAYDLAAVHGTGSNNQPLGIYNQPNVNTVDFGSASFGSSNKLAWTGVVEMERIVATANALLGALGFMTTPSIAADGKTTLKFPGAAVAQGGPIWEGTMLEGEMDGVRSMTTNQVSKTLGANGAASGASYHGLIFGNWTDLIIGQFGGSMEMIVDPYTWKKQGLIEVASFQMADVAVRHPVSFSVGINLSA